MKKKQIVGLVVAVALFIVTGVSSVMSNDAADDSSLFGSDGLELTGGYRFNAPDSEYIGGVKVKGTIQEQGEPGLFDDEDDEYKHDTTLEYIDNLMSDENNQGILLYVDSPGGAVYESEELHQKLLEYKEMTGRPIWGYMAHYAASGGYYVSTAADKIYANPNTTTGSIGVIMSTVDVTGLYDKLGIREVNIASGPLKAGDLTDEQIAVYQAQVDESFDRFVEVVAQGRGMDEAAVRALADGRTYTAKQALSNGLIDEIGLYEDVKDQISVETGVFTFYELENGDDSLFSSLFESISEVVPKSEAQVLIETAENTQGGLLYYADGLR